MDGFFWICSLFIDPPNIQPEPRKKDLNFWKVIFVHFFLLEGLFFPGVGKKIEERKIFFCRKKQDAFLKK